jgi:hypothetical protein
MMWKWILGAAALPVGAGVLVLAVGAALPRDHVAAVEVVLPAGPAAIAQRIRNVDAQPRWRPGVKSLQIVERVRDGVVYVETSGDGPIRLRLVEERPEAQFRSTIADPDLPFSGYWLFLIEPEGEGTRLRIEEHGSVSNPLFRFFARFVFGHDRNIRAYMGDLERAVSAPSAGSSA